MATMGKLASGGDVGIDVERILRSRMLITAMSGGGKSWALRRLLEQTAGGVQQIVLDPEGEFYTLRERGDYLLAGEAGDVPVEPRSAKLLARRLIEMKASAILDLSHLSLSDQRRYVREFLGGLMTASRKVSAQAFVVLDEAHKFAPEAGASESLAAVVDLMSAGRKRGLAGILATQRLSKLHKDAAAEAGSLMVGLSQLDIDVRRAGDLVGFATKADLQRIRSLNPDGGEFFFVGPAWVTDRDGTREPMKVGTVKSTHPSAATIVPPIPMASRAVAKLAEALQDLPQTAQREEMDLVAARERIRELEREARSLREMKVTVTDIEPSPDLVASLKAEGFGAGNVAAWVAARSQMRDLKVRLQRRVREGLNEITESIVATIEEADLQADEVAVGAEHGTGSSDPRIQGNGMAGSRPARVDPRSIAMWEPRSGTPATAPPRRPSTKGDGLDGPQHRVLDAIRWLEEMSVPPPYPRAQVGFVAGYRQSGGFRNTLSKLKTADLIAYPESGSIALTDAGRRLSMKPEISSVFDAALEICDGPMRRLLIALRDAGYGKSLTRAELAQATGYEQSGGFRNTLSKLKTAGMIWYPSAGEVALETILLV